MPKTPKKHFTEDIERAKAIYNLAARQPCTRKDKALLQGDMFRSALMFGVGAVDAYFCDAYADLLARTFRAQSIQGNLHLPAAIKNLHLPVGIFLSAPRVRQNWKWRMAARGKMEYDNVLKLSKIQTLFNPFLPKDKKLFRPTVIDALVRNYGAPKRLVGYTSTEYRAIPTNQLDSARSHARDTLQKRFKWIVQRRHDCIHQCDRPKLSPQVINKTAVERAIQDVSAFIDFCDAHFEIQFNTFLRTIGADAQTRNAVSF